MPAPELFVVSMFHFNLQYCAGGLEGLWPDWDGWDNDSIEDQTIVESYVPLLTLMEQHPDWTITIEMQAYMLEVIARRHPDVLDRTRALADGGQIELVSFHYSDQLWTAFPLHDQEVSLRITAETFQEHDVPLSGVVFTQEGQLGEGALRVMPSFGYDVAVLPRNLAKYWWGDAGITDTLYRYDDVFVVTTQGGPSPDGSYEVSWSFADDGELLATNDLNCYLGPAFVHDPAAVAAYEASLQAQADAGAQIVGIGAFVAAVAGRGASPLPPMLDGTWQPDDTGNLSLWMGWAGLFGSTESDNGVRTANVRARHALVAAEVAAPGHPLVELGWRAALLGQVSDASGWNPYGTEVVYGFDWSARAEALAHDAVADGCRAQGATSVTVDVASESVTYDAPEAVAGDQVSPKIEALTPARAATLTWRADPVASDVTHLEVAFDAGTDRLELVLPWDGVDVQTTPALVEDEVVTVSMADVAVDGFGLALPLGLLHLTDDLWVVKDTSSMHLAASLSAADGEVLFEDGTASSDPATWHLVVVQGSAARALEVARSLNSEPVVTLPCPPVAAKGCGGCDGAAGPAGWLLPAASWALLHARRRRRLVALEVG